MRLRPLACMILLLAAPAAADPVTSPTEALVTAVEKRDEALMKRLTGSTVTLQAQTRRSLRIGEGYSDVLVVTGPDFKLAGGRTGLELILRIPNRLLPAAPPAQLATTGTVTGFELREPADGAPGRAVWVPIVTVSILK